LFEAGQHFSRCATIIATEGINWHTHFQSFGRHPHEMGRLFEVQV
jgi:hypothetical protein